MVPIALVVVVIDQLTKWWALERLDGGRIIDVVWTLRFNLVFNSGTAFSLGRGLGPVLGVVAVLVVLVLVRYGRMVSSPPIAIGLGLVLGGAVGNLIDRMFRRGDGFLGGYVVDFVDFQWWPVFNVADMGIVVGGALVALMAARVPPDEDRTPAVDGGGTGGTDAPTDAGAAGDAADE
jgi:signal peptidase II